MKVLIVDDHTLVRRGLACVVGQCFGEATVREAGGTDEAMAMLREELADIALVDVRMPEKDGLELLREIKAEWPELPVIMLTTYDHSRYVRTALAEGAAGYMLKDASPDDLDQAIRVAMAGGGNVLSTRAIRNLFDGIDPAEDDPDAPRRPETNLTQRELDILALLAEGMSNREISRRLYLSEKTVKAHLAAVFRKLGVTNRTQAAMAAVGMGMGPGARQDDAPFPETYARVATRRS
ncbi:MAG: response regulator transcription factor [Actinobacteria bacterium]|nr:response regulator transcription factor [Actinomycetota bacterium]